MYVGSAFLLPFFNRIRRIQNYSPSQLPGARQLRSAIHPGQKLQVWKVAREQFHPKPANALSGSRRHAFAILSSSPGTISVTACSFGSPAPETALWTTWERN
jgi:hypothetical protein